MQSTENAVAIVGAGFSGTMTALHLLSKTNSAPILLFEKGESFGRGAAYATEEPAHLLNVRAANMSAYPDRPGHFVDWLESNAAAEAGLAVERTPFGTFVSRSLYGSYVSELLGDQVRSGEAALRLTLVPDEVVQLVRDGERYRLICAGGLEYRVAAVVLAAGNLFPSTTSGGRQIANPWINPFADELTDGSPVVVVGSGLTMVDVTLQIRHSGFAGPVIAISRRGLLSQPHGATTAWSSPFGPDERSSLGQLLHRLRQDLAAAEARGISWQSVLDSLRPVTSALWQNLSLVDQRRFVRHVRPWWDIHRHRMAPPTAKRIRELIDSGYLQIRAGSVQSVEETSAFAKVNYRPRGQVQLHAVEAQRVVNATGTPSMRSASSPLLKGMIQGGLARLDRHGLGLDLTKDLKAVGASGQATPNLWALGPLGRGTFWECTAVPDIRNQAVLVAEQIAAIEVALMSAPVLAGQLA